MGCRCDLDSVPDVDRWVLGWDRGTRWVDSTMTDQDLEQLIEAWRSVMESDPDQDAKRIAMARMRELIAMRSPEQVQRMERERGLRTP